MSQGETVCSKKIILTFSLEREDKPETKDLKKPETKI